MSVRKAFVWSFAGQGLSLLAMLVALVWLSRILSPYEMGAYATGQAVNGILAALSALGLGAYIIRERIVDREVLGGAFLITLTLSLLLAVVTFAGAGAIAEAVGDPKIIPIVRLIAAVPLINAFELVPLALLQREMRFGAVSLLLALRAVVGTAVAIGAALLGARYMCVAYAAVAASLVSVIGSHLAAPGHLRLVPSLAPWRTMLPFGLKVLGVGGLSILAMRASELVLASILGLAALGIYSRASTVYNTLYSSIFGGIGRVLMARLAVDQRAQVSLRTSYIGGLHLSLAVMWPMLLGIAVLAGPAVQLVFGPQWVEAAGPLAILMIAQAIAMVFGMSYELFILRDELGRQVRFESIRSLAGLAFFTIGCFFGIEAAAYGRLAEVVLATLMYVPQIQRMTDVRAREFARVLLINAIVAAASIAPGAILLLFVGTSALPPPLLIGASILGGAIFWLGAVHLLRHPLEGELRNALYKGRVALGRFRRSGNSM